MHRDPKCTACKLHSTATSVCILGRGNERADIMVVGEAPGMHEDLQGKAFVGRSGQFLEQHMREAGLDLRDIYFTNAVNCRPPDNRTPSKAEVKACRSWLEYQLEMVKPKYVLLLGNTPLLSALSETGIRRKRGKPVEKDGIVYLPTYHPAFILRDPSSAGVFKFDLNTFKNIVEFGGIPEERELDYIIVDNDERAKAMLADLRGTVSSDLETTGLYPWAEGAGVVSIGFGTARHQWVIPAETTGHWPTAKLRKLIDKITDRLEDCYLVGHNWKFDALWMRVRFGVEWEAQFDTMLAHFLLDENDLHGLKHLAQKYLGAPDWDVGKDVKTSWTPATAKYHAHDLFYTRQLKYYLADWLAQDPEVRRVFDHVLMPCVALFTDAEFHGVYIDEGKMDEAETYLRGELAEANKELVKWGKDINWRSPQQVGALLFDQLKIPVIDKTKTGNRSVSESVIKRIDHPVAAAMLRYRAADKQLSSFIDGWKPFLVNGRLHPSFKLHGTVTGRLSCEHPNLQQVPRDKRIRSLITAPKGWTLLECDLSQIELRIAAELAGEKNMIYAFTHNIDVHWLTAIREIARGGGYKDEVMSTAIKYIKMKKGNVEYLRKNGINPDKGIHYGDAIEMLLEMGPDAACDIWDGWKELRKKAKAVNFGYLYGMWWKKFKIYARDNYGVNVTDEQAEASRTVFFENYPDLPAWHKRQRSMVRYDGYVKSLSGRKRRLPQALARDNTPERQEAERQAINSPVQSFANELNLMAALQVRSEFGRNVLHIVGTVHDAILFEVRDDYVERVTRRVLEVMSGPQLLKVFDIKMSVPIEAEAKVGAWGVGVSLERWLEARAA